MSKNTGISDHAAALTAAQELYLTDPVAHALAHEAKYIAQSHPDRRLADFLRQEEEYGPIATGVHLGAVAGVWAARNVATLIPSLRPQIVCLCGSTRFRAWMAEANRRLTMDGHIVVAPGVFQHDGDPLTETKKALLDQLHLRKIDMADQVWVVAPEGYIGDSTKREMAYATETGKPITVFAPIGATP